MLCVGSSARRTDLLPKVVFTTYFDKKLRKKPPQMQGALARTIARLVENPRHPGLNVHRVRGEDGVWEAYIDRSNRLTFQYDDSRDIVLRNHCSHDILRRP